MEYEMLSDRGCGDDDADVLGADAQRPSTSERRGDKTGEDGTFGQRGGSANGMLGPGPGGAPPSRVRWKGLGQA
ncbi:hypothetical protein PMIN03_000509 [Paraphaeosphaeria minitans]